MIKMSFVINERLERRFRDAVARDFGVRKGAISEALGQAIELWLDHSSARIRPRKQY
jgi:hypothetical protein